MERNSPELEGGAMLIIPVTVLPCLDGIERFQRALGRQNGNVQLIHSIDKTVLSCGGLVLVARSEYHQTA